MSRTLTTRLKLNVRAVCASAVLALLSVAPACGQAASQGKDWTASWGSSQLQPYGNDELAKGTLDGTTLRQIVHLSAGGARIRLHLANTFGNRPLLLRSVSVALRGGAATPVAQPSDAIDKDSQRAVTFNGGVSATIPMGAEFLSDAIDMPVAPLSDLVVTMLIDSAPSAITFHGGARATAFLAQGDRVSDVAFVPSQTFTRWYFLAGVEVSGGGSAPAGSVIAFGDSITDGHGATTDGNDRWPDVLARRLATSGIKHSPSVVNEGIGGNCILQQCLGPNALARFDRDVLAQPGAKYLIVLEGINDLGGLDRTEEHGQPAHDLLVANLETAFVQMAARAHAHGLRMYGATLTPYVGSDYYHPGLKSEADRQKLNQWIRTATVLDGVIDFDAVLRDPAHPDRMLAAYDSGDHLHPGPAGYRRMGEPISLQLFSR